MTKPELTVVRARRLPAPLARAAIPVLFGFALFGLAQDAPFRTTVNLVLLDAAVTDRKGAPVSGLTAKNFTIEEEGERKEISRFATGETQVSLGVVADYSGSMRRFRIGLVQAGSRLLENLDADDEIFLLAFNEKPVDLLAPTPIGELSQKTWRTALLSRSPDGNTALFDALAQAGRQIADSRHERRVLILISDGADTISTLDRDGALDAIRRAGAVVYAVGLFREGETDTDAGTLKRLARETGGLAVFEPDIELLGARFETIVSDLRARYVLGFQPSDPAPGQVEVRSVRVTVRDDEGRKLRVRSRQEYEITGPPLQGSEETPE